MLGVFFIVAGMGLTRTKTHLALILCAENTAHISHVLEVRAKQMNQLSIVNTQWQHIKWRGNLRNNPPNWLNCGCYANVTAVWRWRTSKTLSVDVLASNVEWSLCWKILRYVGRQVKEFIVKRELRGHIPPTENKLVNKHSSHTQHKRRMWNQISMSLQNRLESNAAWVVHWIIFYHHIIASEFQCRCSVCSWGKRTKRNQKLITDTQHRKYKLKCSHTTGIDLK